MNHIAMVIPGLDRIGGAEQQMILLAKGLHSRGWRVSVVALSGTGGTTAAELTAPGVASLSLDMRKGLADPRGWIRFHHWLRQERPDVVHAHLPHAAWFARWSRVAAPVRVLVDTLHTSSTGTWDRKLGYRLSARLPDQVTAVSRAVAEAHLLAHMATAAGLVVLPNGVDTARWQPDAAVRAAVRRELSLKDEFLWVAAGRLDPVKDYPTLLRAMAAVPTPAHLIIAGSGPLETELRCLTRQLTLGNRVRFLGFQPDIRRWMQAADAFVLSSRWEGLPMALLEAAACSIPAVATDVQGTREAILEGQTGLLTVAESPQALQGAMTRMMQLPPENRSAMGERAHAFVLERFALDEVLDRWEKLYSNLLRQRPYPTRWRHAVSQPEGASTPESEADSL